MHFQLKWQFQAIYDPDSCRFEVRKNTNLNITSELLKSDQSDRSAQIKDTKKVQSKLTPFGGQSKLL